jgi:hypothetical protein
MDDRITTALKVLELSPGASLDDVKKSYRLLAKVWHPDRFPTDKDLQQRGLEKIKEINSAYELLTSANLGSSRTEDSAPAGIPAIKFDGFIFYGSCFDEIRVGELKTNAPSGRRLITPQFLEITADWMQKDHKVQIEMVQTLSVLAGHDRVSHSDFQKRTITLSASCQPLVLSLMKPIIRIYIRDKLSGVAADKKDFEIFSKGLRELGWDGQQHLFGDSYIQAESVLTNAGADDLIDRLLNEGSAGYWADTRMLYKLSYSKGPHSAQDWGRYVGLRCKNNAPYC